MAKCGLVAGIILFSIIGAAQQAARKPQQVHFTAVTAENLMEICKNAKQDDKDLNSQWCLSYLAGFLDGFSTGMAVVNSGQENAYCVSSLDMKPVQISKVVMRYGYSHPKDWHKTTIGSGAILVVSALHDAFPCEK